MLVTPRVGGLVTIPQDRSTAQLLAVPAPVPMQAGGASEAVTVAAIHSEVQDATVGICNGAEIGVVHEGVYRFSGQQLASLRRTRSQVSVAARWSVRPSLPALPTKL